MGEMRVYGVCGGCLGSGLLLDHALCSRCGGSGRGQLYEIREERQDTLELLGRQVSALERLEKHLAAPPVIVNRGGIDVPVLPEWLEQHYAVMNTNGSLLSLGKDESISWTKDPGGAAYFDTIKSAVEFGIDRLPHGVVAAVVVMPQPNMTLLVGRR